jgi:hypothetical protein
MDFERWRRRARDWSAASARLSEIIIRRTDGKEWGREISLTDAIIAILVLP